MTQPDGDGTAERAEKLRRMTADFLRSMTPQERDRTMQVHLAQARGPTRNAMLLFDMICLAAWILS